MNIGERVGDYLGSHSKREVLTDALTATIGLGVAALWAKAFTEMRDAKQWKREHEEEDNDE